MLNQVKEDRGQLLLNEEECKGCGLCIGACPPKQLHQMDRLNRYGYRPVAYSGHGCNGCGICFTVCPEPGAITVLIRSRAPVVQASACGPLQPAIAGRKICAL